MPTTPIPPAMPTAPATSSQAPATANTLEAQAVSGGRAGLNVRVRPTKSHPTNGYVQGVYRGSEPYDMILRGHKLPEPRTKGASQRFKRLIHPLMERCEDIATETSCWLLIAAQHVTSQEPMFYYVSPRLANEAQQETEAILTATSDLVSQLRQARRTDAVEFQRELQDERRQKQDLQNALESSTTSQAQMAQTLEEKQLSAEVDTASRGLRDEATAASKPTRSPKSELELIMEHVRTLSKRFDRALGNKQPAEHLVAFALDIVTEVERSAANSTIKISIEEHMLIFEKLRDALSKYQGQVLNIEGVGRDWKLIESILSRIRQVICWLVEVYEPALIDPSEIPVHFYSTQFSFQRLV
ncbi:hypothetical protein MD484_g4587, partial [Candolleomyces efflorescens]